MKGKILFLAGLGVGYVLGTRAGRERYEQIKAAASNLWNAPVVQKRVDDVQEFVVELVATLRAAESLDNPAPVVQVIDAWRHTAEAFADPELAAILASDTAEDLGEVPAPDDAA